MSTIAVARKGGKVAMAADTLTSYGSTLLTKDYDSQPKKIFQVAGTWFGVVGSAAHGFVLESALAKGEYQFQNRMQIFETFRTLHPILKKEYYMLTDEEDEHPYESSQVDLVIANQHGIFGVYSMREVYEYSRYWATGTGWHYALGAMYSAFDRLDSAEAIARIGVEASCEFDQSTAGPVDCEIISLAPCETSLMPSMQ